MAKRNKKVIKLRKYRDKLLVTISNLEGRVQHLLKVISLARRSLHQDDILRAYALLSELGADSEDAGEENKRELKEFDRANELAKELSLVYRFLIVERQYTQDLNVAVSNNDWLRVKALCSQHIDEAFAHEKALMDWGKNNGLAKVREDLSDDLVA